MKISRRYFVKLSSLSTAFITLTGFSNALSDNAQRPDRKKDLYDIFMEPDNTHKPFVRWWWNGNRLRTEEILRELDVMKEAGIGGVEINPIKFPERTDAMGVKEIEWLSDGWIKMLEVALKGARERGIICDIIVGSGWPFGGTFLDRDEQTQMVALGTRNLKGPMRYQIPAKELLESVEPSIHSPHDDKLKELISVKLVPSFMRGLDEGIDLTTQIKDTTLHVDVPSGDYILYYLVKLTGFMAVINGGPGASGPVLNHYNKSAVEKYLNRMSDAIRKIGPMGNYFRAAFTDSIELEGANWCDDLFGEFHARNGYDLAPYFPFILYKTGHMGNALETYDGAEFSSNLNDELQRVRYDFETTRSQLFTERFINTFHAWCQDNGIQSRMQAYGRECHPLESSMLIDIPECETWLGSKAGELFSNEDYRGGRAYTMINKFVSSGARFAGKKLISCEEITNVGEVFNASLEEIKVAGDQSNLSGVTHSILHGFNYSPPDAPFPGWVRYGTFFNERNTWWPYFKFWAAYKARLSAVFQNAELYSDIAVLHPIADLWMKHGPQRDPFPVLAYPPYQHQVWEAIHQNGNGCDYISETIIQKAEIKNGQMAFGGRSYQALMLIEVETLLPETATALSTFAKAGVKIIFIGKTPGASPKRKNSDEDGKSVATTIHSLIKDHSKTAGKVPAPEKEFINWYKGIQDRFDLKPYVTLQNPNPFISQVHYRYADFDIFFFVNSNINAPYTLKVKFPIQEKEPWLWDPENGQRYRLPNKTRDGFFHLDFEPAASKLIVFDKTTTGASYQQKEVNLAGPLFLSTPWRVRLLHVDGSSRQVSMDEFIDFKDHDDLKAFAGEVIYENEIQIRRKELYSHLDLGRVYGISEVEVNGKNVGFKWYGSHVYDITTSIRNGRNTVKVKLTTTIGNYIKSLNDNEVAQIWTKNQPLKSIGLLGPVKVLQR